MFQPETSAAAAAADVDAAAADAATTTTTATAYTALSPMATTQAQARSMLVPFGNASGVVNAHLLLLLLLLHWSSEPWVRLACASISLPFSSVVVNSRLVSSVSYARHCASNVPQFAAHCLCQGGSQRGAQAEAEVADVMALSKPIAAPELTGIAHTYARAQFMGECTVGYKQTTYM